MFVSVKSQTPEMVSESSEIFVGWIIIARYFVVLDRRSFVQFDHAYSVFGYGTHRVTQNASAQSRHALCIIRGHGIREERSRVSESYLR